MSIVIDLAPDEEIQLRQAAAARGQDIADYLLWLARQAHFSASSQARPEESAFAGQTLAEALAGRIGLFRSESPSDMARNSEEEFGKIMDEKQRQGHV